MRDVRILHCADLHLGARMTANLDARQAKERREELLLTFERVVRTAHEQEAVAVLIVGDLFDTERVTVSTRRYVGQLIADSSDIIFAYVSGNHDRSVQPLFPDDCVPGNWIDMSGEGWTSLTLPACGLRVTLSATSNTASPLVYDTIPSVEGYHIVMLHGQVSYSGGAARDTVCLPRLAGKGIDYLALGHEHSYRCEALDARGVWCYSGCPEGRGYDECGEKGVVLLTLTQDADAPSGARGESRFLPIAHRTLHHLCVNVTREDNERTLTARVLQQTAHLPARDIVLIELLGEIAPEQGLDAQGAVIALRERFYAARLDDHTTLALDPADYLHDISLKGEFIRTVMATSMPQQMRDRVIVCGLRALRGEEAEL